MRKIAFYDAQMRLYKVFIAHGILHKKLTDFFVLLSRFAFLNIIYTIL